MSPRSEPRRCTARNRKGDPCRRAPIVGGTVCWTHGGATRQAQAAAVQRHARALAEAEAQAAVQLWGGRRDVHPAQALLELVQWKAAEVAYWRMRVSEISEDDLTWGTSKVKTGGDDAGTTEEAKPHIALALLRQAEQDLAAYSAASLKAGVDAAMVQIAQVHAARLLDVIRVVLADSRLAIAAPADVQNQVLADAIRGQL